MRQTIAQAKSHNMSVPCREAQGTSEVGGGSVVIEEGGVQLAPPASPFPHSHSNGLVCTGIC